MKKFIKILILPIVIIVTVLGSLSNIAFAKAPLSVQFIPNPLFNKANFVPGDETSGKVTVTNNSDVTQNILTEAINISDNNNLGSQLHIIIVGDSGTLFDDTLANFFSTAGEVSLDTILNGESKTFTYTVSFMNFSDNSYQGKTLGFDVCVGFKGGNTHCGGGDTIISNEGHINGTGGGGGGSTRLTIFNEQALFTLPLSETLFTQADNHGLVLGDPTLWKNSEPVLGSTSNEVGGNVLVQETISKTEKTASFNSNLATAIASGFHNLLSNYNLIFLLILLVFYLIWKLRLRKKYERLI